LIVSVLDCLTTTRRVARARGLDLTTPLLDQPVGIDTDGDILMTDCTRRLNGVSGSAAAERFDDAIPTTSDDELGAESLLAVRLQMDPGGKESQSAVRATYPRAMSLTPRPGPMATEDAEL